MIAYNYGPYDFQNLKLFFLSLLWRALESSHGFYQRMELGPHEPEIRQAIIDSDAGDADFYSVVLAKFPKPYGILDPYIRRFDGVKFSQIYLAEYVAYINLDKRPLSESFRGLELNDGRSLIVLARDPANSKRHPSYAIGCAQESKIYETYLTCIPALIGITDTSLMPMINDFLPAITTI